MMIIVLLVLLQSFLQPSLCEKCSEYMFCLFTVHDNSDDRFFEPECGQENLSRRVINGREAARNRYPWMVSVQSVATTSDGTQTCTTPQTENCGGSMITDRHVLTAAHCLAKGKGDDITLVKVDSLKIVVGAHTAAERETRAGLPVKSFVVHEDFRPGGGKMSDDIAIIELEVGVTSDGVYNPVCLPDFGDYEKDSLFLIGWGNQNSKKKVVSAAALFEVSQPERSNSTCFDTYGGVTFNSEKEICAGDERGSCQGDAGGPLSMRKDGYVYEVGIASYSSGGCNVAEGSNWPGVYERVTYHLDWIKKHTAGAGWCAAPHHPFVKA